MLMSTLLPMPPYVYRAIPITIVYYRQERRSLYPSAYKDHCWNTECNLKGLILMVPALFIGNAEAFKKGMNKRLPLLGKALNKWLILWYYAILC
jgi:hypothetical protein